MEKGNEQITSLDEKKRQYKKQLVSLKQQNTQVLGGKDTIIQKQEQQI